MRLPKFLTKISPIGETLEAIDAGTHLLAEEAARRNRQLSASTAEESLALWEADYSLACGGDAELRRARVRAAMAGGRTLTVKELEALPAALVEADRGEAEEDFARWKVTLNALYEGRLPTDTTALEEAVARRKPAHLTVEVVPIGVLRAEMGRYLALTGGVYMELHSREGNESDQKGPAARYRQALFFPMEADTSALFLPNGYCENSVYMIYIYHIKITRCKIRHRVLRMKITFAGEGYERHRHHCQFLR